MNRASCNSVLEDTIGVRWDEDAQISGQVAVRVERSVLLALTGTLVVVVLHTLIRGSRGFLTNSSAITGGLTGGSVVVVSGAGGVVVYWTEGGRGHRCVCCVLDG